VQFYAGDDADAKQAVRQVLEAIGYFPADLGSLALPMSRKNRWTFLFHSSTVRNGTTTPDQAHVISS
jgi:predicted dinucleotide-binding enzyme